MQGVWGRILGYSLLAVLLLNVLHAFFLYQKQYEPITITYTASSDFDTFTWLTFTEKYSTETIKTESVAVKAGVAKTISTEIEAPNGIQFLGCYWSWSDRGSFSMKDFQVSSSGKTWELQNLQKLVAYSSENITPTISANSVSAISTTSAKNVNGWLMINSSEFEKLARTKQFKPLRWIASILLFLLFVGSGYVYKTRINGVFKHFKVEGPILYQSRIYLLYLWMVLLPFWLIISHVFMAVSVALVIVHFISVRDAFKIKQLTKFIPLTLLFVAIAIVNLLAHPVAFAGEAGDYIYFLLAPFVFIGIEKKELKLIFRIFQGAVFLYVVLLIASIFERYFQLETSYAFSDFFFETVELYWHSSYLAGLIMIALLFQYTQKKPSFSTLVITILAFLFMYLSQARLPIILGLLLMIGLTILKFPKRIRKMYTIIGAVVLIVGAIWVIQSTTAQEKIMKTFLTNRTHKMDARSELWEQSFVIAENNLLVGVGRDNIREKLSRNIEQNSSIKYRRYNTHNQYLEFLLGYGLLALLVFIAVLFTPFLLKYRNATIFTLYLGLAMLVESYLSRQAGVVLFSLWYSFFIWYDSKSN